MNIENYLLDKKWEKLIKPLEKYLLEIAKKNPLYTNLNINLPGVSLLGVHETILISEKFGFIEWLVNNDKIDQWKVYDYEKDSCWELTPREWIDDFPDNLQLRDRVLMLLSISNSPISDLISYLK